MSLFTDRQLLVIGLIAAAGAGWAYWRGKRALSEDLNPTSDKNLAYRSVNAIGEQLTGDPHFSLGAWLYDITHKDDLNGR